MLTRAQIVKAALDAAFIQGSQNGITRLDYETFMASVMANQGIGTESGDIVLASCLAADMTLTTDQAFTLNAGLVAFTAFVIKGIVAVRRSGAFGTACAGGVYSAASKGGNAWVANTQSFAALTGAAKIVRCTLAAIAGTEYAVNAPILSLTTGNTGALVADLYLTGQILDG